MCKHTHVQARHAHRAGPPARAGGGREAGAAGGTQGGASDTSIGEGGEEKGNICIV